EICGRNGGGAGFRRRRRQSIRSLGPRRRMSRPADRREKSAAQFDAETLLSELNGIQPFGLHEAIEFLELIELGIGRLPWFGPGRGLRFGEFFFFRSHEGWNYDKRLIMKPPARSCRARAEADRKVRRIDARLRANRAGRREIRPPVPGGDRSQNLDESRLCGKD